MIQPRRSCIIRCYDLEVEYRINQGVGHNCMIDMGFENLCVPQLAVPPMPLAFMSTSVAAPSCRPAEWSWMPLIFD